MRKRVRRLDRMCCRREEGAQLVCLQMQAVAIDVQDELQGNGCDAAFKCGMHHSRAGVARKCRWLFL